jgi:hypothetical protein
MLSALRLLWDTYGTLLLKILFQVLSVTIMYIIILLDYVHRDKRTRLFRRFRNFALIIPFIFILVSLFIVVLDDVENKNQFKKLSQPIQDIYVNFIVNIPINHHMLNQYSQRVKSFISEIPLRAYAPQVLKHDVYVGRSDSNGNIISIVIPNSSEIFPKEESEPVAFFSLIYIGLILDFYKGQYIYSPDQKEPDLTCAPYIGIDGRSRRTEGRGLLAYNLQESQFLFEASNIPCPSNTWGSSGKILSIPDLAESTIVVRFNHPTITPYDQKSRDISELRKTMLLRRITIMVSGKRYTILQHEFEQHSDPIKGQVYVLSPGRLK